MEMRCGLNSLDTVRLQLSRASGTDLTARCVVGETVRSQKERGTAFTVPAWPPLVCSLTGDARWCVHRVHVARRPFGRAPTAQASARPRLTEAAVSPGTAGALDPATSPVMCQHRAPARRVNPLQSCVGLLPRALEVCCRMTGPALRCLRACRYKKQCRIASAAKVPGSCFMTVFRSSITGRISASQPGLVRVRLLLAHAARRCEACVVVIQIRRTRVMRWRPLIAGGVPSCGVAYQTHMRPQYHDIPRNLIETQARRGGAGRRRRRHRSRARARCAPRAASHRLGGVARRWRDAPGRGRP